VTLSRCNWPPAAHERQRGDRDALPLPRILLAAQRCLTSGDRLQSPVPVSAEGAASSTRRLICIYIREARGEGHVSVGSGCACRNHDPDSTAADKWKTYLHRD
jgi:hypothetical protein